MDFVDQINGMDEVDGVDPTDGMDPMDAAPDGVAEGC